MTEELKNGSIYCSFENNGSVFNKTFSATEFADMIENKNYKRIFV